METLYKTLRFDMIEPGTRFTTSEFDPKNYYIKKSARKAEAEGGGVPFNLPGATKVTVEDRAEMEAQAKWEAMPRFDGTRESARNDHEFYLLHDAHENARLAAEKLDDMADYITRKMADIKQSIRRDGVTDLERKRPWESKFEIAPSALAGHLGMNELGELQGNGNIDMLIGIYAAERRAFAALAKALGYRLTNERSR